MKRSQQARRRSLMIETSSRRTSSVRRLRRKLPAFAWMKKLELGRFATWGIVACGAMALFITIAFLSPMFRVKKFQVIQASPFVEVLAVEEILQDQFSGHNMLFLNKNDIRAALRDELPELREIQIVENWPRGLELTIDAAKPKYNIFNTETTNFTVISEDGIVLAEELMEGLPVIKVHQYEDIIKKHQQILSPSQLVKINEAEGIMDADLMLSITAIEVYLAANELHFTSRDGMKIWIDLSRSIETQLDKLASAEGKIKLYKERFDHIDLRIPQQIFWQEL